MSPNGLFRCIIPKMVDTSQTKNEITRGNNAVAITNHLGKELPIFNETNLQIATFNPKKKVSAPITISNGILNRKPTTKHITKEISITAPRTLSIITQIIFLEAYACIVNQLGPCLLPPCLER